MKYPLLLILLTLNFSGSAGCCSTALAAETRETREARIYRCGEDGRDLRDAPCPESPGKLASGVRYDQPDAADVHAARERARSVAHEADALERKRLATEAQAQLEASAAGTFSAPRSAAAQPEQLRVAQTPRPPKPHKARPSPAASTQR